MIKETQILTEKTGTKFKPQFARKISWFFNVIFIYQKNHHNHIINNKPKQRLIYIDFDIEITKKK